MIKYTAVLKKFAENGDKTGWTYIELSAELAAKLKPGNKKSFRVKGLLDAYAIEQVSLVPMGEGAFILPVNAGMRKGIGKREGASVKVQLEADEAVFVLNEELVACLQDDPAAMEYFNSLAPSHQRYFHTWIESAKTEETKGKRIAQSVIAASRHMSYSEMIRALKADKDQFR